MKALGQITLFAILCRLRSFRRSDAAVDASLALAAATPDGQCDARVINLSDAAGWASPIRLRCVETSGEYRSPRRLRPHHFTAEAICLEKDCEDPSSAPIHSAASARRANTGSDVEPVFFITEAR
jgi:hypothetical protein